MKIAQSRPLTDALIAMLESVVSASLEARASKVIGDHHSPTPPQGSDNPETPYIAVYRINQMISGAPFGDSSSDAEVIYQLTSVGRTRAQAEGMADAGRRAILDYDGANYTNPIIPDDGQRVIRRELESAESATWAGSLCNVIERFRLDTTPDEEG